MTLSLGTNELTRLQPFRDYKGVFLALPLEKRIGSDGRRKSNIIYGYMRLSLVISEA